MHTLFFFKFCYILFEGFFCYWWLSNKEHTKTITMVELNKKKYVGVCVHASVNTCVASYSVRQVWHCALVGGRVHTDWLASLVAHLIQCED